MELTSVYFMLWAKDMDRAVAFWRDVMGLEVRMQSPDWSELVAPRGAVVALHGGADGSFRETGLGFDVADLDAACEQITSRGGQVRRAPTDQPDEGIRIADLTDTEGNGFMLTVNIR